MRRVVVVGNGMVGSRFVEELTARDTSVQVTVLGAEEYEPYNRVLLSEVVAGKVDLGSLTLPRPAAGRVRVRPGAEVDSIDRAARTVTSTDGDAYGYDVLVLATGAQARIPEIAGLTPLPAGVHALRTLDDAREIVAATANARRAVVLGGGVLGLEAGCGLARRGLHVTVVHRGPHLMDRQLDAEAAAAVAHGLRALGIEHRVGARTESVLVTGGRLREVRLVGGEWLPADLLLVTAGTVPETGLAGRAGLAVGRGVVVGLDGSTSDPAVFAIGDCAEPPEGGSGLLAQGWEQARRLAAHLTGAAAYPGEAAGPSGADVVRLKAHGLDVVAMGGRGTALEPGPGSCASACGSDCGSGCQPARRSVRLSDPAAGRHLEVVVADGVVVGATCVGAGAVGADLISAYTRRTPAPTDPAQLLLRPLRGSGTGAAEPSATLMPDRATVCRCNGVTKGELVACWRRGERTMEALARSTRATTGCGGCTDAVQGLLTWLDRSAEPALKPA